MVSPLQARIDHILTKDTCSDSYPWATARQLEGRSAFEAFVECVQPSHGPRLLRGAVAGMGQDALHHRSILKAWRQTLMI